MRCCVRANALSSTGRAQAVGRSSALQFSGLLSAQRFCIFTNFFFLNDKAFYAGSTRRRRRVNTSLTDRFFSRTAPDGQIKNTRILCTRFYYRPAPGYHLYVTVRFELCK